MAQEVSFPSENTIFQGNFAGDSGRSSIDRYLVLAQFISAKFRISMHKHVYKLYM